MIEDGVLPTLKDARYAGWSQDLGRAILNGRQSLGSLAALVEKDGIDPKPVSGQQERLENLVNRYV